MVPRTPQDPKSQAALGKAIRQLRNKQGKSQATLATEAGITPNMLSLIERGEANPSWATVQGIAHALDISITKMAAAAERLADR
ncbi:MAG TPA: helix-turn-helix transcriptional regulator [Solirubrobacterales bacterium]|nr:helix-turn-helix transcriptional regulator [Solirubrobacterales bacterium]